MKLLIDTNWATFVEDLSQEKQLEFFWAIFDYGNRDCSLKCWSKIAPLLEKGKIKYYNRLNNLKQFNTERESESVSESESESVTESEPERESEREYKYKIENIQDSNKGVVGGKEKGVETPNTKTIIDWADVLDRWNRIANKYGLSQIKTLTEKRKKQFRARLEEQKLDTEQFFYFVNKALWTSPFLQGYEETIGDGGVLLKIENENKWKADFDFCLQSQSFSRMRENFYCRRYPERLVEWEELERQQGGTNAD